jgi:uncharacterized protein
MRIYTSSFAVLFAILISTSYACNAQTEAEIADFTKAAKFDDVSQVKSLVASGISPNTFDPVGNTMLIVAINDKSYKVIDFLIANKSTDIDLPNKNGETPLMIAAIDGELGVVKTLVLQKKANVNPVGWTPLHYASTRGNLEIAQFLIANGAVVNALSPSHTTPLMMAVQSGNEVLVKLLLDNGADLKIRNTAGFSAIDVADLFDKTDMKTGLSSRWLKLYKEPYSGGPRPIKQ